MTCKRCGEPIEEAKDESCELCYEIFHSQCYWDHISDCEHEHSHDPEKKEWKS